MTAAGARLIGTSSSSRRVLRPHGQEMTPVEVEGEAMCSSTTTLR